MHKSLLVLAISTLAHVTVGSISAASIPIGYLSFDLVVPGEPGNPGVNGFTIGDLSGDPGAGGFALPPDFPVFTELTFLNASITLNGSSGPSVILLGTIGPGFFTPASLQFPDTEQFTSAQFAATLSPTTWQLVGGGSFNASSILSTMLFPAFGDFLSPGLDFAIIEANEAGSAEIPEPATYTLFALGIGCIYLRRRRS